MYERYSGVGDVYQSLRVGGRLSRWGELLDIMRRNEKMPIDSFLACEEVVEFCGKYAIQPAELAIFLRLLFADSFKHAVHRLNGAHWIAARKLQKAFKAGSNGDGGKYAQWMRGKTAVMAKLFNNRLTAWVALVLSNVFYAYDFSSAAFLFGIIGSFMFVKSVFRILWENKSYLALSWALVFYYLIVPPMTLLMA